jgi:enoyl-CoA hydratase
MCVASIRHVRKIFDAKNSWLISGFQTGNYCPRINPGIKLSGSGMISANMTCLQPLLITLFFDKGLASMAEAVLVQHEANTITLLLNRPESRNALSHELLMALADALARPTGTKTTGIVITGAGDCFSAGADFRELTGTIEDLAIDEDIALVNEHIRNSSVPVTALINGACLGGAVDLALACDQRTAMPNACIQVPASRLGLLYNPASVQRMVLRYGAEIVSRLLVMGEKFDASSALTAGLVSTLAGKNKSDVNTQVRHEVQLQELSPVALATKQMIDAIEQGDFDPDYWQQIRLDILSSKQRFEAVAAFKSRMQSK